ncbi:TraB/GumN family protein [Novosphingobium sp. 1949]|uniref:TraB/GumN family protein n=1 Tax=Novosphingobium organovorum TaxID=2930092 RepID=A0ABT0B9V7_9SPHN|nr:TraB/GumN family protein [Novosphingobium organovorum]MCJ2181857.1 TraB/GumN family protein [Novosphingobium organovorum]
MHPFLFRVTRATTLALALLASPTLAQAPAGPARPDTAASNPERVHPALWKVSDKDTTIWLFGTIHVLPKPVDWFNGPVAKALKSSRTLVTEVPMDDNKAAQSAMLEKASRTDGRALRDTLSPENRAAYEAAMTKLGLAPAAFDGNDAWFAALMLSLIPLQMQGYDLSNGIDKQITDKARALGLTNAALETADYQIGLFEDLPVATQDAYLADVVEALPTLDGDIAAMVDAWKQGKAKDLAEILNQQENDPLIRETLLTARNQHWARWIEARLKQPGTVFMAVGAGHLAGQDSVQALLAKDGVRAVRVQ